MTNYNFSTLNDREFEELVKDVLNKEFSWKLKSYPQGRDKGIDLRQSSTKIINEIVVQVKHYRESSVATLKSKLIKEELPKLKAIKPKKYFLATSLKLSAYQQDLLVNSMKPYLKSQNNIISKIELNEYLANHKNIILKYTRLWFSDVSILEYVINNGTEKKSMSFLESLSKKAKFFVYPSMLNDANKILKKHKILLITGLPGVGKSTLAEILLLELSRKGLKVHLVDDLEEAENTFSSNDTDKQVFFIDDFLGANYSEIINISKSETRFTRFVERVYSTPNKYMILTTRTIILNYATEKYEKINRIKGNLEKFELKIENYTKFEKAKILYNHLYFNKLSKDFFDVIRDNNFYLDIVQHQNYTPRLIEFISNQFHLNKIKSIQYRQFITQNLNNPEETWRYSFLNQITSFERALLFTIFSFTGGIDSNKLRIAFEARMKYEIINNNYIVESNQFDISLRLILNGFVSNTIYNYKDSIENRISFINPSLTDFISNYLTDSYGDLKSIISSIIYYEQLNKFKSEFIETNFDIELQNIIFMKIKTNIIENSKSLIKNIHIYKLTYLTEFCCEIDIDEFLISELKKVVWKSINNNNDSREILKALLKINCNLNKGAYNYINENIYMIMEGIFPNLNSSGYVLEVRNILEKFGHSYKLFIESLEGKDILEKYILSVLSSEEDDMTYSIEDEITNIDELDSIQRSLDSIKETMYSDLEVENSLDVEYQFSINYERWNSKIDENIEHNKIIDKEEKKFKYQKIDSIKEKQMDQKIIALFS